MVTERIYDLRKKNAINVKHDNITKYRYVLDQMEIIYE